MSDKPTTLPDLSESLAPDLDQAIRSYHAFKQEKMPEDPKGFTAYHNACKSALMHIALLLKLIQGAPSPSSVADNSPNWIIQARQALQNEAREEEDTDDLFFD